MKRYILYVLILALGTASTAFAQLEGKKFISGSAALGFSNQNPVNNRSENGYSYNFNIGLGKFKTATKTGEWTILSSLGGGKNYLETPTQSVPRKGISNFALGGGYNWNFYKHFSDKFGIFGGPGLILKYAYARQTELSGDFVFKRRANEVSVSFQVAAGAYYALNERWWLIGSLAFSNPVSVAYNFGKSENLALGDDSENSAFQYRLSPSLNFPSVGLGLRYFFKD